MDPSITIDWQSTASHILINPRTPEHEREEISRVLSQNPYPGHLWVETSGSRKKKWVALSKEAFLHSALAVNDHLQVGHNDKWLFSLPLFHVGGLAITARAHLSSSHYRQIDWDPLQFVQLAHDGSYTLSALVPAQVYDLVDLKLPSPPSLRACLVGGGFLSQTLYREARRLGWPLLPTYGMTECCSQVATAPLLSIQQDTFPSLTILPHISARINEQGTLSIKSRSLFTTYAYLSSQPLLFEDPKIDGWFLTEDLVAIENNSLIPLGRADDMIKIGGESVSLARLEQILLELDPSSSVILAVPDERLGTVIHLATSLPPARRKKVVDTFNTKVLPFEKIRKTYFLSTIPKTPLGKPLKEEILQKCLDN